VKDQAELARPGFVTLARVTQVMNLLDLAPDLQEEILCPTPSANGRDRLSERSIRPILESPSCKTQRKTWNENRDRSNW
jgi:hypothetical protein